MKKNGSVKGRKEKWWKILQNVVLSTHTERLSKGTTWCFGFHLPYPRPSRLSDPFSDFGGPESEELQKVINTADDRSGSSEFHCIFQPYLPGGDYPEAVYFLPWAFKFLVRGDDTQGALTDVIWYVSAYADRLQADDLLQPCRNALYGLFETWTREFIVEHYDQDACRKRGWIGLRYHDIVRGSARVFNFIGALIGFATHIDLAANAIQSLVQSKDDLVKSASWLVELVSRSNDDCNRSIQDFLRTAIKDRETLDYHASAVRQSSGDSKEYPYLVERCDGQAGHIQ